MLCYVGCDYFLLASQNIPLDCKLAEKLLEEKALVTAIRNTFVPRLRQEDATLCSSIVHDLWPNVGVPMLPENGDSLSDGVVPMNSVIQSQSEKTPRDIVSSRFIPVSLKGDFALNVYDFKVIMMLNNSSKAGKVNFFKYFLYYFQGILICMKSAVKLMSRSNHCITAGHLNNNYLFQGYVCSSSSTLYSKYYILWFLSLQRPPLRK